MNYKRLKLLWFKSDPHCNYCRTRLVLESNLFNTVTIDHLTPKTRWVLLKNSKGESLRNNKFNLTLCCNKCNSLKGNKRFWKFWTNLIKGWIMETIKRSVVRDYILNNHNDKIFSVQFIKKDNSVRDMVCRLGVSKGVKSVEFAEKELKKRIKKLKDNGDIRTEIEIRESLIKDEVFIEYVNSLIEEEGLGLKFDPKEYDLICVYDLEKAKEGEQAPFRMINIKTLIKVSMNGKTLMVED